jgi:thiosulfate/3-mercaptopyruvate sulfurtransferase
VKVLTSVAELAGLTDNPSLRTCDVRWYLGQPGRGRTEYEKGHIPGAAFVDLDTDLAGAQGPGRHPLPDPGAFCARMAALGIGSEHLVVAYDSSGGTVAARLWWMLRNLGHRSVSVLDGGLQAWIAAGQPITDAVTTLPATRLDLAGAWHSTIDREGLGARLESLTLLDARAPERYRGEAEPIDPAAGHIPTALSYPTTENLSPDGTFRPADELRERFAGLSTQTVSYCGSGVTACHNILAMVVAGLDEAILYPGSWSDWSQAGMPVAIGGRP